MRMGTIMEIKGAVAVVLTDDCDFVKIPRKASMELGQRVEVKDDAGRKNRHLFDNKIIGAIIAACLIFGITGAYVLRAPSTEEPFAYVTLDINPSLELGIDKEYKIVSVHNFNLDGKKVLDHLALKGEPLDKALKGIIDEARILGYFMDTTDGEVLITAVPNLKNSEFMKYEEKVIKELSDLIDKEEELLEKAENDTVNVTVETVKPAVREEAKKKNISAGRQYLIDNAKKSGATDITAEEIRKANITELLKNHADKLLGDKAYKKYRSYTLKHKVIEANVITPVNPKNNTNPKNNINPINKVTPVNDINSINKINLGKKGTVEQEDRDSQGKLDNKTKIKKNQSRYKKETKTINAKRIREAEKKKLRDNIQKIRNKVGTKTNGKTLKWGKWGKWGNWIEKQNAL